MPFVDRKPRFASKKPITRPPSKSKRRSNRSSRWNFFFGGGPVLNFIKLGFERTDIATPNESVEFDDFDLDVGLNILAGVQSRGGMFMDLKTTVYADPGMRFVVGTNLWGGGGN